MLGKIRDEAYGTGICDRLFRQYIDLLGVSSKTAEDTPRRFFMYVL